MSYDPQRFTVGWRDIGAGYLLGAAALVGLSLISLPTEKAEGEALSPTITVHRASAPDATGDFAAHDEEWLDSVRHAEWHDEPLPAWRPVRIQACAPDCMVVKSNRSPS